MSSGVLISYMHTSYQMGRNLCDFIISYFVLNTLKYQEKININCTTVNVDIFACINFCGFMKMGNLACIKIRVLSITGSLGYYNSNFRGVYIFADI